MTQVHTLQCGERLSIDQVERLHTEIEEALRDGQGIELNAHQVQFCDTAGLQMLLALKRQMAETETTLGWVSVSPSVVQTAELLGLKQLLEMPDAEAA